MTIPIAEEVRASRPLGAGAALREGLSLRAHCASAPADSGERSGACLPGRAARGGFSLIEAVVALAVFSIAVVVVATLFVLGGRMVQSGRELTAATTIATGILEQMEGWSLPQLYGDFGRTPADVAFQVDTLTDAGARRWQPEIDAHLPAASALVRVTPVGGASFDEAKAVRIEVTLRWGRGLRRRQATLETVRF